MVFTNWKSVKSEINDNEAESEYRCGLLMGVRAAMDVQISARRFYYKPLGREQRRQRRKCDDIRQLVIGNQFIS